MKAHVVRPGLKSIRDGAYTTASSYSCPSKVTSFLGAIIIVAAESAFCEHGKNMPLGSFCAMHASVAALEVSLMGAGLGRVGHGRDVSLGRFVLLF